MMIALVMVVCAFILGPQSPEIQEKYPVSWHIFSEKTGIQNYTIKFEAYIDKGWVIYGMQSSDGGPVATSFEFDKTKEFHFLGKPKEDIKPQKKFEPLFDTDVLKFSQKAIFSQAISKLGKSNIIKGRIQYMACDGTKCLPPTDVPFVALLK